MNINQSFYNYIKPYLLKLRDEIGNDFVVFGSAPLYLLGVVDFTGHINDLDIVVNDVSVIPEYAVPVTFQKNQQQKLYKITIDGLNIDIGPYWPGYDDMFKNIFLEAINIDNFKFANLEIVENWKKDMVKRYGRQKDKDYLTKIAEFKKK